MEHRPPGSPEESSVEPLVVDRTVAARLLETSERHVARLVNERRIPFVRVGGKTRFEVAALTEWIAANRVDINGAP